jgi:hypothetical protein
MPWKWHCYSGIKVSGHGEHCLLELTATAAAPLFEHINAGNSLRGTLIEATRPSGRENGRIWIRICPPLPDPPALPLEPEIPKLLATLWGLSHHAIAQANAHENIDALAIAAQIDERRKHAAELET